MLRTAFFGTPEIALPLLDALIGSKHEVLAAITSPDRPRGRGLKLRPPPVKERAVESAIGVLQYSSLRGSEVQAELGALRADVFVVCAYGLILPPQVLAAPRLGCLNVHFSLLPELRGAAPVPRAILEGYEVTGVTIMQMDEGLDTGPTISLLETPIRGDDTTATLGRRLSEMGAVLLLDALELMERGKAQPQPQDESRATMAPKLTGEDARLNFTNPAEKEERRVRAMDPAPGAWTSRAGSRLKVWKAAVAEGNGAPGEVAIGGGGRLVVSCARGSLSLIEVQPEGRARMGVSEYLRGYRPQPGEMFG